MHPLYMIRKGLATCTLLVLTFVYFVPEVYANAPVQESKVSGKVSNSSIFAQRESGDSVGNQRDSFFSVISLPNHVKLLTGTRGTMLLISSDGRVSGINMGSKKNLYSTLKVQTGTVLIGADRGQLYKSDTSLKTFKSIQLKQSEDVFNLLETVDNKVFAVGAYGLFMSSTSPFEEWHEESLPWGRYLENAWKELGESLPHLYSSCSSESGATYIVGEYGLLLKYEDTAWVKLHGGNIEPALYGCVISDDGKGITAVGQRGLVIHSSDGGLSWEDTRFKKKTDLYGIKNVNGLNVVMADQRQLFISKNWKDWSCKMLKGDSAIGWYIDMLATSDDLILVGNKGKISYVSSKLVSNILKSNTDVEGFKSCE
ncbi:MAG: hypothetical protein JKX87_07135 [Cycloclasticus sp.]|nr:hypothetical protein [Cycloclasticus sp.]